MSRDVLKNACMGVRRTACLAVLASLCVHTQLLAQSMAGSYSDQNSRLAAEEAKLLKELVGTNLTQTSAGAAMKRMPPISASESMHPLETNLAEAIPEEVPALPPVQVKKNKNAAASRAVSSKGNSEAALISNIQRTSMELADKLREREERIAALRRELDETRNRLIIAETEVERLSTRLDGRNRSSLGIESIKVPNTKREAAGLTIEKKPATAGRIAPLQTSSEIEVDMPVVTVIANKAALRTGPGPDNSPLMEVSRGTVLTVETRNGNWYRVNTPTGTRAWISGEVVRFGGGGAGSSAAAESGSSLRMGGIDSSAEDEAFKLLKQRSK